MTPEEQNLITGLFERLRQADTGPKDPGAEQLIRTKTAELPTAPYLMAQAVLVQEHALANAQARIADLERQVAAGSQASQQGGGFLSGVTHLFGGGKPSQASPPPVPTQAPQTPQARPASAPPPITVVPQAPPYPSTVQMAPSSGGGFLQSAMATAAGVAGGSLLFQGIENLIGHNAGPFGPALSERGGFFGQPTGGPTEVVENNYYTEGEPGRTQEDKSGDPNYDQNQVADYDPSQDMDSDSDFDSGFDDGGGGDDSTFA
ncbi:MAG: DUF2076 domain-containing protein [Chthoniobacterales bacterium]